MTKLEALNKILIEKLDSEKGKSVLDAINNASKSYNGEDNATSITEALNNLSEVFEKGGGGGKLPDYEGATVVTPSLEEQTLATAGKSVNDDITVNAISPVYEDGAQVVDTVTDKATTAKATKNKAITDKSSKVYIRPSITSEGWYKAQEGDTQTEIQIDEAEQAKIVPENIKKGVTVLGVAGTLDEQGGKLPDYEGATVVTPSLEEQTLATAGKSVNDDITVNAISPVYEDGAQVVDTVTDEATTAKATKNKAITDKSSKVYIRPSITSEGWYKAQEGDTQTEIQIDEAEQAKIVPENIKKGVTVLGVAGTLEGGGGGTTFAQNNAFLYSDPNEVARVQRLLENVDMSNITFDEDSRDFAKLFYGCVALKKVILPTVTGVLNTAQMFFHCVLLLSVENLTNFDVSAVTDMREMFVDCEALTTLDLSSFNTGNVTNMNGMFNMCHALASLNLSGLNTSKVTDMSYMFHSCCALTTLDLSSFDTSKVTDMSYMFSDCTSLTELNLSSFDTSKVKNMDNMFSVDSALKTVTWGNNWGAGLRGPHSFSLVFCSELTHASALDLINKLVDRSAGEGCTVIFATSLESLLTADEIAIATAKGWSITFE